jgi:peptidoglycan/LPS O-acetylase OafA/YrhL
MRSQIKALTATRAIAAIMVVIHHFGANIYPFNRFPNVFHIGDIAVSYFFVLSGFVLYISYNGAAVDYGKYLNRRIGRIVPIYLFALLLFVVVALCYYDYVLSAKAMKEILLSATFLQAYISSYPLVLNSPAWTISVEMFFYLLFPLFLLLLSKHVRVFVILTIVLSVLSQYFHLKYYPVRWSLPDSIADTVFFNPLMHINQFLIGMIGGYLYSKVQKDSGRYGWLSTGLFAIIFLLIASRPQHISYQVGLIAPVFMLFILSMAISNPRWLNFKGFVFLGEISYGIYILQFPVYKLLSALNLRYLHVAEPYFFCTALVVLILTASVTYYIIEKPLRTAINSMGSK